MPNAKGTDQQKGRNLNYSADLVKAYYNEHGEMERLEANGNAHLISQSKAGETDMSGNRLNLFFTATGRTTACSLRRRRAAMLLESKPLPDPAGLTADTKNIHSDSVDVFMKPDGKELDHIALRLPGRWSFCRIRRAIEAAGEVRSACDNYGARKTIFNRSTQMPLPQKRILRKMRSLRKRNTPPTSP